ncbi:hypothetical protein ADUPG1_007096 [Aduncisulcus paluster]|uniref:Uncharacterized protein n=2 Tax=Aduncisulcus paluster TaxID=2918883 RepID=A0ABQ5KME4_9EUKA|nr:hypothetical protein ADUPG1_007096 [Aduncisulcus paluster]
MMSITTRMERNFSHDKGNPLKKSALSQISDKSQVSRSSFAHSQKLRENKEVQAKLLDRIKKITGPSASRPTLSKCRASTRPKSISFSSRPSFVSSTRSSYQNPQSQQSTRPRSPSPNPTVLSPTHKNHFSPKKDSMRDVELEGILSSSHSVHHLPATTAALEESIMISEQRKKEREYEVEARLEIEREKELSSAETLRIRADATSRALKVREKENQDLRKELNKTTEDMLTMKSGFESKILEQSNELISTKNDLMHFRGAFEQMEKTYEEERSQNSILRSRLAEKQADYTELEAKYENLEGKLAMVQRIADRVEEAEKRCADMARLRVELEALDKKHQEARAHIASCEHQIKLHEEKEDSLQSEVDSLKPYKEQCSELIAENSDLMSTLESEVHKMEDVLQGCERERDCGCVGMNMLVRRLNPLSTRVIQLMEMKTFLASRVKVLEQALEVCVGGLSEVKKDSAAMKVEVESDGSLHPSSKPNGEDELCSASLRVWSPRKMRNIIRISLRFFIFMLSILSSKRRCAPFKMNTESVTICGRRVEMDKDEVVGIPSIESIVDTMGSVCDDRRAGNEIDAKQEIIASERFIQKCMGTEELDHSAHLASSSSSGTSSAVATSASALLYGPDLIQKKIICVYNLIRQVEDLSHTCSLGVLKISRDLEEAREERLFLRAGNEIDAKQEIIASERFIQKCMGTEELDHSAHLASSSSSGTSSAVATSASALLYGPDLIQKKIICGDNLIQQVEDLSHTCSLGVLKISRDLEEAREERLFLLNTTHENTVTIEKLNGQIAKLEDDNERLRDEVSAWQKKSTVLQMRVEERIASDVHRQVVRRRNELEEENKVLSSSLDSLRDRKKYLDSQLQVLEDDKVVLESKLGVCENLVKEEKERCAEFEERARVMEHHSHEVIRLEERCRSLSDRVKKYDVRHSVDVEERERLRQRIYDLESKTSRLSAEHSSTTTQLDQSRRDVHRLQTEKADAVCIVKDLLRSGDDKDRTIEQLVEEKFDVEQENMSLRRSLSPKAGSPIGLSPSVSRRSPGYIPTSPTRLRSSTSRMIDDDEIKRFAQRLEQE